MVDSRAEALYVRQEYLIVPEYKYTHTGACGDT